MQEYKYITQENIISFIKKLGIDTYDNQWFVVGLLQISNEVDAAMEVLNLSEERYLTFLFTYILED